MEMDSSGDFPEMIDLVDEKGFVFQPKVVYEWGPSICSNCRKFGHLKQNCLYTKQEKLVWTLKSKTDYNLEDGNVKIV